MSTQIVILSCLAAFANALPPLGYPGYGLGLPVGAYGGLAPAVPSVYNPYSALHQPGLIGAPVYPKAIVPAPAVVHAPVYQKAIVSPVVKHVVAQHIDPNPQYSFSYGVSDPHTGDNKHAEETLVNGVVHGSYSLHEPDGTIRKVTYTADKINGFNAVVEKTGVAHHVPAVAKVIAPVHGPAVVAPAIHAPIHGPVLASPAYAGYAGYHGYPGIH